MYANLMSPDSLENGEEAGRRYFSEGLMLEEEGPLLQFANLASQSQIIVEDSQEDACTGYTQNSVGCDFNQNFNGAELPTTGTRRFREQMGSQEQLQGSLKQHANLYSARDEGLQGSQVIQNRHLQSLLTELKQSQRPKRDLDGSSPQVASNNFTNNQNNYVYNQLSENCRDSLDTFTHHTRFTQNTPDLMQNSERRSRPKYTGASNTEGNRTERQHTSPNIRLTEAINTRSSVKKSNYGSQMEDDDAELTKVNSARRSEVMRENVGQTLQTSGVTELVHTRNISKGILREQTTEFTREEQAPEGLRLTAEEREARRHLESMGSSGANDETANISKYVELNFYHQS